MSTTGPGSETGMSEARGDQLDQQNVEGALPGEGTPAYENVMTEIIEIEEQGGGISWWIVPAIAAPALIGAGVAAWYLTRPRARWERTLESTLRRAGIQRVPRETVKSVRRGVREARKVTRLLPTAQRTPQGQAANALVDARDQAVDTLEDLRDQARDMWERLSYLELLEQARERAQDASDLALKRAGKVGATLAGTGAGLIAGNRLEALQKEARKRARKMARQTTRSNVTRRMAFRTLRSSTGRKAVRKAGGTSARLAWSGGKLLTRSPVRKVAGTAASVAVTKRALGAGNSALNRIGAVQSSAKGAVDATTHKVNRAWRRTTAFTWGMLVAAIITYIRATNARDARQESRNQAQSA